MNLKAQLAARTMFALAYRHGDILREGWQNILDCMLQLYRAKMLPTSMVEVRLGKAFLAFSANFPPPRPLVNRFSVNSLPPSFGERFFPSSHGKVELG